MFQMFNNHLVIIVNILKARISFLLCIGYRIIVKLFHVDPGVRYDYTRVCEFEIICSNNILARARMDDCTVTTRRHGNATPVYISRHNRFRDSYRSIRRRAQTPRPQHPEEKLFLLLAFNTVRIKPHYVGSARRSRICLLLVRAQIYSYNFRMPDSYNAWSSLY